MKKLVGILVIILFIPVAGNGVFNTEIVQENKVISNEIVSSTPYLTNDVIWLIHPLMAHPVIVDKEQNFTILFSSPSFDSITVEITTAFNPMPDRYILKVEKMWHNKVWHVVVNTGDAEYELYNLTIDLIIDGKNYVLQSPKSVAIEKINGNFTFVHLTDFHIGDPRGMKVSIARTIGWKAARKAIEEINLLHPSFVIITGDLVFGQLYPFEYTIEYKKLYNILLKFNVPIFLCPGNHDGYIQSGQDGFKLWKQYFGWLNYSFDYGYAHFVMVNSYEWPKRSRVAISYAPLNWGGYISDEQLKWIENDLKKSNARLKVLALHHNPLWDTKNDSLLGNEYYNREKLLQVIWRNGVNAVFDGHVHYDDVTIANGTLFITTTTVASSLSSEDAYWGYRLISVRNWSIVSYNYKEPKFSIPLYNINSSIGERKAIVENNLEMPVNVTLSFYLDNSSYNVENGKIIMKRMRGDKIELYVEAHVPAKRRLEIKII